MARSFPEVVRVNRLAIAILSMLLAGPVPDCVQLGAMCRSQFDYQLLGETTTSTANTYNRYVDFTDVAIGTLRKNLYKVK